VIALAVTFAMTRPGSSARTTSTGAVVPATGSVPVPPASDPRCGPDEQYFDWVVITHDLTAAEGADHVRRPGDPLRLRVGESIERNLIQGWTDSRDSSPAVGRPLTCPTFSLDNPFTFRYVSEDPAVLKVMRENLSVRADAVGVGTTVLHATAEDSSGSVVERAEITVTVGS
jgi:hypothetical protein